jgi:hypothetical protein
MKHSQTPHPNEKPNITPNQQPQTLPRTPPHQSLSTKPCLLVEQWVLFGALTGASNRLHFHQLLPQGRAQKSEVFSGMAKGNRRYHIAPGMWSTFHVAYQGFPWDERLFAELMSSVPHLMYFGRLDLQLGY